MVGDLKFDLFQAYRFLKIIYCKETGNKWCWLLVTGCWLLVAGCWLLVTGYWLLVTGYWLLVTGKPLQRRFSEMMVSEADWSSMAKQGALC